MQVTAQMVKELREQTGAGMMDAKAALVEADGVMEEAIKILRKKGLAAAGKKAGRVTAEGAVQAYVGNGIAVLVEVNCETDFVGRNDQFKGFVTDVAKVIAASKSQTVEELLAEPWPDDAENLTVAQRVSTMVASIKENISIRRFARYDVADNAGIGAYIHGGGKIGVMVEVIAKSGAKSAVIEEVAKDVAMHVAATEPRFLGRDEVTEHDLATEHEIAMDAALKSGKPANIAEKMVAGKMEKFYAESCLLEQPFIKDDKQSVQQYVNSRAKEASCEYVVTRYTRYKLGEGIEKKKEDFAAEVASFMK